MKQIPKQGMLEQRVVWVDTYCSYLRYIFKQCLKANSYPATSLFIAFAAGILNRAILLPLSFSINCCQSVCQLHWGCPLCRPLVVNLLCRSENSSRITPHRGHSWYFLAALSSLGWIYRKLCFLAPAWLQILSFILSSLPTDFMIILRKLLLGAWSLLAWIRYSNWEQLLIDCTLQGKKNQW